MANKTGHGGKRAGAGRPPKFSEPIKPRTFHLPLSVLQILESMSGSWTDKLIKSIMDDNKVKKIRASLIKAAKKDQ